jgi:muconolactone delta-isomerase
VEYLVTMSTHVPEGTAKAEVDDMRAREARRSKTLAAQGHLLRLWRPPLQPGEWRTFGLFAAADRTSLEEALVSMPLRVWRTDEVLPLEPHPNDPGPDQVGSNSAAGGSEFMTTFVVAIPPGTAPAAVDATEAQEAERAHELAGQGHLIRLWATEEHGHALGLWRAHDADQMQTIVASLPLGPWMSVETTPLSVHPSDPGLAGA